MHGLFHFSCYFVFKLIEYTKVFKKQMGVSSASNILIGSNM